MASVISHAVAALSLGTCFYKPKMPRRIWVAGVVCSVIPDIDVVGFRFGIAYGNFWGHRGVTHSLLFAALLSALVVVVGFRERIVRISRFSLGFYLFLATASHGFLDAMTNGGMGVAFFSPFNNDRYFLPWRPILVSPLSAGRFFSHRGFVILRSELLWIWLPAGLLAVLVFFLRRKTMQASISR